MAVSASEATTTHHASVARSAPTPLIVAPPRPTLSVVIVNFCQWNNTARLVQQLRSATGESHGALASAEIVIVDNHSPPHVLMERLRRSEGVSLRRFSRNRGFARAVNEGCRLARADWLLVLNPDMTVPPGFLDRTLQVIQRDEAKPGRDGVIGFRLRHADGSPQASCGQFPTFTNTLMRLFWPRRLRKCQHVQSESAVSVPWVTGCCLLLRRDCLEEIGGFDEEFFLYYEDVDLCRRTRAAGWSVRYEPGVELIHHSPLHTRQVPPGLRLITRHALLEYARKHWPGWQSWLLRRIVGLEARWRERLARWGGHREAARFFGELRGLVADLRHGRDDEVRQRLRRAARRLERSARLSDSK